MLRTTGRQEMLILAIRETLSARGNASEVCYFMTYGYAPQGSVDLPCNRRLEVLGSGELNYIKSPAEVTMEALPIWAVG